MKQQKKKQNGMKKHQTMMIGWHHMKQVECIAKLGYDTTRNKRTTFLKNWLNNLVEFKMN